MMDDVSFDVIDDVPVSSLSATNVFRMPGRLQLRDGEVPFKVNTLVQAITSSQSGNVPIGHVVVGLECGYCLRALEQGEFCHCQGQRIEGNTLESRVRHVDAKKGGAYPSVVRPPQPPRNPSPPPPPVRIPLRPQLPPERPFRRIKT